MQAGINTAETTGPQTQTFDIEWALKEYEAFEREHPDWDPTSDELPEGMQDPLEALEEERFQRKLAQVNRADDVSNFQTIVLGKVLHGTKDNTDLWQQMRSAFAVRGGNAVALEAWPEVYRELVFEIDQTYLGKRDTQRINASAVLNGYRQRVDSGITNGAVGVMGQLMKELEEQNPRNNEVDFLASVELCRSAVVRRMQREKWAEADRLTRGGKPPEEVMAYEREKDQEISALMAGRTVDETKINWMRDLSGLERRMTEAQLEPISCGLPCMDGMIGGGVTPGRSHRLHVIAADTGVGKSQLATMCAMGLVLNGCTVLFISVELDDEEMQARLIACFSQHLRKPIPSWTLEKGRRDRELPRDWHAVRDEWYQMETDGKRAPLGFVFDRNLTCEGIEATIQQAKDTNPSLSAVFVDHFQDIAPADNRLKGYEDAKLRARALAGMAKTHRVDIFVCAQLNREAAKEEFPGKEHIADGYSLARYAHAMWTIGWYKHPDGSKDFNRRWLINAKARTSARKADNTVDMTDKWELQGQLDYSFLEQVS